MDRAVTALLLAGLLVTSGCIGFLTGEEALTFEANEVSVSEEARSDTGYEQTRKETQTITRNFSAAGQTRKVKVTNHVAEYKRQASIPIVDDQELARFTVLSTPQVEVLNRTFNPVGDLSNRQLAQRVQQKYESVSDVKKVGERTVTVLGEETTVSKFSAKAKVKGGQTIDVYVHIAQVAHGSDFVVAVAVYPQELDGEQEKVDRLLGGIQHETGNSTET